MQKSIFKKRMKYRFKRMVCWTIYRWTKSWSNRIWRIAFTLFLLLGTIGSLWHLGAGFFLMGKVRFPSIIREGRMVPAEHFPDSTFSGIPLDSLHRDKEGSGYRKP